MIRRRERPRHYRSGALLDAARWAANGVLLRVPLNPWLPAVPQEMVLPAGSVIVTWVLLNVDFTWTIPLTMFFFALRLVLLAMICFWSRSGGGGARALGRERLAGRRGDHFLMDFLPATVFLGPLRERALVRVR